MSERVILAFSGGLDTSFCAVWLKENGYDVITVYVNTAGLSAKKCNEIERKAYELGVAKHYTMEAEDDFFDKVISYLIKTEGLYQGVYPQLCSDRYIIVEKCIEVAKKEGTNIISHGCTAMGNDQVRFDLSIKANGDYKIIAPIREIQDKVCGKIRLYEQDYLEKRGFKIEKKHSKYSINSNILGTTISGSEIDECEEPSKDAFFMTKENKHKAPISLNIDFDKGVPVAINGKKMKGAAILKLLNEVAGSYGVGRFIYTGDCIIGIKGRIVFECPGLHTLLVAHKALEEAVLTSHQNQFKMIASQKWAHLVFSGLYYEPLRRDIELLIDEMQRSVVGSVRVKISAGGVLPVAYKTDFALRDATALYAQSASWHASDAEGFIKLFGMSTLLSTKRKSSSHE